MIRRQQGALALACVALTACSSFDVNPSSSPLDAGVDAQTVRVANDAADTGNHTGADVYVGPTAPVDAGRDSGVPVDAGFDTGLSPLLVPPPVGETSCVPQDGDEGCPTDTTCRIASTTTGRCDGYTAGHEGTWPCSVDSDCDDTLQCFNGECKVLCPLGESCAGGCECYPVGNETTGICCPGS